jgi:hypothetical protein
MKAIIPSVPEVLREAIILGAGLLVVAVVLNSFPKVKKYITDASITIKDQDGNVLY